MTSEILFLNKTLDAVQEHRDDVLSLQALLRSYNLDNDYQHLAEALPYGQDRLELVDILNAMVRMGHNCSSVETRICDIDPRLMPCAFVEEHTNRIRTITEQSNENISGTAYIFTKQEIKDPKEQKEALAASGRGWFITAIWRFRKLAWNIGIVSLALNIISLGSPLFLMAIYDRVLDLTSANAIYIIGIGAVIALVMEVILRSLRSKGLSWFAARIDNIVSNRVLSRLLQMPSHAIERASVASQVARLRTFESVREFLTGPLFLTLLDLPFTCFAFLAMVILGGTLALIPVGLIAIYGILICMMRAKLKFSMYNSARTRSTAQMQHIELFEKREALRLTGMSEVWREQFRDISAQGSLQSFHSQYLSQILETSIYTITTLAGLSVIYLGVSNVWQGVMTGGSLFASLIFFWRITGPWQALVSNIPKLEQLYRSIQQIDRLMALDTERESSLALGKLANPKGSFEFSKVGLRYSKDRDPVFVGLSFEVRPGDMLAIAGGNGSGKSTLLKLALGLYRPQAGAIYLDGRDIRQLDPIELRKNIAYVPQIPELFEGTIADNLRLGNQLATDKELWHALELADAKKQIEQMPGGLDAQIGIGSDNESFRSDLIYRLSLARAYAKNSKILLIDEIPYAILNSRTGKVFIEHLKEWRGRKTILIVSHRDDHINLASKALGLLFGGASVTGSPEKVINALRNESFKERRRVI